MKRVISLLLVLCLIPASLVVPVMAADSVPASVFDLLNDVDYRLFYGTENMGTYSEPFAEISTDAVTWRWNVLSNEVYSVITVAIIADVQPNMLQLYYDGAYSKFTYLYNQGKIYYYQLTKSVFFDDSEIRLRATWTETYSGLFGVDAFYGYVDHAIPVTTADTFCNLLIGDPALGYRSTLAVDSGIGIDVPIGYVWFGPYDYADDEQLLYAECYYKISSPISRANSISWMVYTVGGIDSVGCRLEKSDGTTVVGLPCEVEFCGENQVVVEMHEEMYRCNVYMITADLSGHNLRDLVVTLSYRVQPVHSSGTLEYGWGIYSSLHACAVLPEVSDMPWYAGFANWLGSYLDVLVTAVNGVTSAVEEWGANISDGFSGDLNALIEPINGITTAVSEWGAAVRDGVVSAVNGLLRPIDSVASAVAEWGANVRDGVVGAVNGLLRPIDSVASAVAEWGANVRDGVVTAVNRVTVSIGEWGQKILAALTPDDPGSDQFHDDLQQAGDELQNIGDVMDSVTRPDIGQINPAVDNIVSPSDITMLSAPLVVVFDNPYILSMFILSFTMALAGFVLYGKR